MSSADSRVNSPKIAPPIAKWIFAATVVASLGSRRGYTRAGGAGPDRAPAGAGAANWRRRDSSGRGRPGPKAGMLPGGVIDPIAFEVVRNALGAAAEEMALALRRSAYSTNI